MPSKDPIILWYAPSQQLRLADDSTRQSATSREYNVHSLEVFDRYDIANKWNDVFIGNLAYMAAKAPRQFRNSWQELYDDSVGFLRQLHTNSVSDDSKKLAKHKKVPKPRPLWWNKFVNSID